MYGCQQVLIDPDKETKSILEYLCTESNNVYNCAVYYARQIWFKTKKIASNADICGEMARSKNRHFTAIYVSSVQQTCNAVAEAFKSFSKLLKLSKQGNLGQNPKVPYYRKTGGFYTASYPKRWLKLTDNGIRIPLGSKVKAWFGLDAFYLPMPSNLDFADIKEIRILPRNQCFYAEFIYKVEVEKPVLDPSKALGIDHGIDNWLTCVSNIGTSFIVDGKWLKSANQWYNKSVATIKDGKPQGFWSHRLARITEKRNRQMRDAVNKAARIVINHCLNNGIGKIVFGWNIGQKDSAAMGKKNNQRFVQIPTAKLKERINQLCELYGIEYIETEESYTSKASFVDRDYLPTIGAKPDGWKESGRRVKRGLYRTGLLNWYINADCNGAANILRKVATMLGLCLNGVGRGVLAAPQRVKL
ncbi:MAG: transposase [Pseudanabaenaceae cyanobacterium bins.39]|nr:transposase [Pseudanabaenaceae cyanobacterium bins.39]